MIAAGERHDGAIARRERQPVGVHDELVAVLVVPAIAHQLSHVVQQRRGLEQRALLGGAAEHLAELVVELEREVAHLLDVAAVALAALDELAQRPERDRCRPGVVAPAISRSRPSRRPKALTVTLRASARSSSSAVTASPARMMSARSGLSPTTLRRCSGVRVQSHSSSCSTSPVGTLVPWMLSGTGRPRRPIDMRPRLVKVPPEPTKTGLFHSRQGNPFRNTFRTCFRSDATSRRMSLPRLRCVSVSRTAPSGIEYGRLDETVDRADELEAATADVGHDGARAVHAEMVGHRAPGEGGLGLGVDDAQRDAELVAHPLDELLAVGGLAHRGGGDGGDAADATALADHAHAGEPGHGALHGGGVEVPGGGDALGEARLVLHLVDDGEAGAGIVLGDEEADRVGADVEGGEALAPGDGRRDAGVGLGKDGEGVLGHSGTVCRAITGRSSPRSSA